MLSSRNINSHGTGVGRVRSRTLEEEAEPQTAPPVTRPSHLRSRSYLSGLSPNDPKLRKATTLDTVVPSSTESRDNGSADKDVEPKASDNSGLASHLLPKIHLPGHGQKHRASQDSRTGSLASNDISVTGSGPTGRPNSQLPLQHLGLHLPVNVRRTHSHRHTRSEVPRSSMTGDSKMHDGLLHPNTAQGKGESMLTKMASNLSSKGNSGDSRTNGVSHKGYHQYSSSDFRGMTITEGGIAHAPKPGLRRRATSDPRAPQPHSRFGGMNPMAGAQAQFGIQSYLASPTSNLIDRRPPMTEVEVLFYKAERARRDADRNVKDDDVTKITTQLAESNVELHSQLSTADRTARDMMRRLDYAHDTLLRTNTSLVDTISSFQNLCEQSDKLIRNFESRTSRLDKDMRQTLNKHRKALLEQRGKKVAELEERSHTASRRAEEMNRRLENCRIMVKNYTQREQTKRKAWKGVIVGSLWGCTVIVLGILLGLALWWWKTYGGLLRHDLREAVAIMVGDGGATGPHTQVHDIIRDRIKDVNQNAEDTNAKVLENVPDDVRSLLNDIAARHNGTYRQHIADSADSQALAIDEDLDVDRTFDDSGKLERLFEKLEI